MSPRGIATLLVTLVGLTLGGAASLAQNVPYQRLVNAGNAPQDWLTYSGNYNSQRYSALNQINRQNVAQLRPAWMYRSKSQACSRPLPSSPTA
jgi:glucose dehydrogenase